MAAEVEYVSILMPAAAGVPGTEERGSARLQRISASEILMRWDGEGTDPLPTWPLHQATKLTQAEYQAKGGA